MTLPNGVQSTALYDRANRLTEITHTAPGNILLGQHQYQFDGNGLAQIVTETLRSPDAAALTDRFLESSGLVVMEAEHVTADSGSSHTWQSQTTQQGYGGDSYMRALPDVGALDNVEDLADSAHLAFPIQISTPADYTVWIRGMAPDASGDSLHIGLDGSIVAGSANLTGFAPHEWSWASITLSNTQAILDLTASATYTLDLWMREDGLRVDRVMLITDTNTIPTGIGPAESPREVSGGSGLATHTVIYGYDPLNRLTSANYSGSLNASYGYEYDTLGNRMTYTATLTNTVVTTYTYNLANRLQTAKSDDDGIVWHYVYDNNGSRLQQLPGSLAPTAGAVQYSYDQSRRLVQVESHDGTGFQLQAEMVYDGNGRRLQAIAHADASSITATSTLDPRSGLPLSVDNGTNITLILYGQAAIGEYTSQIGAWRYYLGDAQFSVRQLVDAVGTITQAQTYAPYGILLHQAGDGGGLFGYKGGQSSSNGLWYFGDGYFDPHTGQYISTGGETSLPLAGILNPVGLLFAPILFIGWRRRKGKKGIHPAVMLFLGVLFVTTLSSCSNDGGGNVTVTPAPPSEGSGTEIQPPSGDDVVVSPPSSGGDTTPIGATPTCEPENSSTRPLWLQEWDDFVVEMQEDLDAKYVEPRIIFNQTESDSNAIEEPQTSEQSRAMIDEGRSVVQKLIASGIHPTLCSCNTLVQTRFDLPVSTENTGNFSLYEQYFNHDNIEVGGSGFSLNTDIVVYGAKDFDSRDGAFHSAIIAWHNLNSPDQSIIIQTNSPSNSNGIYYTTTKNNNLFIEVLYTAYFMSRK